MEIQLRAALPPDVDFAKALYFTTMRANIESLFGWDERRQEESFVGWFDLQQAQIIVADGCDVGWLQTRWTATEVFLGSLYVKPEMQGRGIGSYVLNDVIAQCRDSAMELTLAVMKINPAIRLYERLGFRVTHEDQYKFYMRFEA